MPGHYVFATGDTDKNRTTIYNRIGNSLKANFAERETDVVSEAISQLREYFEKRRREFTIPLLLTGTDFQKDVWRMLQYVPYGARDTYAGLSLKLNRPASVRAVASANGANSLSIFIPCHRIVGSNGELTGYAGGLSAKKKLLELESLNDSVRQLRLFS